MNRFTVSVIMRSKNSMPVIAQALQGLYSQDFRDFELLVVDSGSTDTTLEVVAQYPARVIRIRPEDYFPGRVLNAAIREARGDILVFQNSDVVPLHVQALGRLLAPFDDPRVAATFARQLPRPEADTWVRREYALSFPESGEAPPWITLSLPLAAVRRSAWEQHPFYDAAWGSEDTEWGAWARSHGHEVRYVPDSRVMHSHNYTLRQLYGRRFIEGEADAFIYDRAETLLHVAARIATSTLREGMAHVRGARLVGPPGRPRSPRGLRLGLPPGPSPRAGPPPGQETRICASASRWCCSATSPPPPPRSPPPQRPPPQRLRPAVRAAIESPTREAPAPARRKSGGPQTRRRHPDQP